MELRRGGNWTQKSRDFIAIDFFPKNFGAKYTANFCLEGSETGGRNPAFYKRRKSTFCGIDLSTGHMK
jgi:hypothetical protein